MKYSIPLFTVSFVLFFTLPVSSGELDKTLHEKCLYPTLQVYCPGSECSGTAVVLRSEKSEDTYRNIALTCAHVVRGMECPTIYVIKYKNWSQPDGQDKFKFRVIASDPKIDLALIAFESDQKLHTVDLGFEEKLFIGNEVVRVGGGLGDDLRVDFGKVTGVLVKLPSDKSKSCLRTSVYTVPGDSGGPLFHNNKLVGVMFCIRGAKVNGHMYPVFGVSYAVPISDLKKLDESVNNTVSYAFDSSETLPVIPFVFSRLEAMKPKKGP